MIQSPYFKELAKDLASEFGDTIEEATNFLAAHAENVWESSKSKTESEPIQSFPRALKAHWRALGA